MLRSRVEGSVLLALADDPPNLDAIPLSPVAGWLLLASAVALCLFFVAHEQAVRRFLLRMDDPRPMAAFRIAFGIVTLCNVNGLWEFFEYLFTDEGLFSTEVARHLRARGQFSGFGDGVFPGEPTGFFDFQAFLQWLGGPNYSLLLFWDSPTAFWIHLVVWWIFMACFIFGFQTKWTKWIAWFLFHSIILRNLVFWEGTENVFRTFFFYLCLSRCGEAYSIDNWLRCRRLRREGRLAETGDPPGPEHPSGREAIYRLIPFWPRFLTICQVAAIYVYTGAVKNGPVWHRGDAFYYAFNLDHFYRIPPQTLSAYLGVNFFRLNTHVTHYWEALFPLVVVGLVLRWWLREQLPPLEGWRRRLSRAGLAGFAVAFLALILWVYPVHYRQPEQSWLTLELVLWLVGGLTPVVLALLVWGYAKLRDRPPRVTLRGREATLDLQWFCRWFLGRRLWLSLGVVFHAHLILLMNIGWFSPALLCGYLAFLNGEELSRIGRRFARVARRLGMPLADRPAVRGEDPSLPHLRRDGLMLPTAAIFTALVLAILGVIRRATTEPDLWHSVGKILERRAGGKIALDPALLAQSPQVAWGWFGLVIALLLASVTFRRVRGFRTRPWTYVAVVAASWLGSVLHEHDVLGMRWTGVAVVGLVLLGSWNAPAAPAPPLPARDPTTSRPSAPWAYGPLGRLLAGGLFIYHFVGVGIWLLPEKWCLGTFRIEAREPFTWWLSTTQTTQGWAMFAPNPPRRNMHMRVVVTDADGQSFDLNTDVYACFAEDADEAVCDAVYPIPWIWYSRNGKMNRRIIGGEGGQGAWYQRWHGRWVCRQWALDHDGELPEKVELIQVGYTIPEPEWVWEHGPFDPKERFHSHGKQEKQHTTHCRTEVEAQPTDEVRARHGLPPAPEGTIHRFKRKRCLEWQKELVKRARDRGEEVADDDPRFVRCLSEDASPAAVEDDPGEPAP